MSSAHRELEVKLELTPQQVEEIGSRLALIAPAGASEPLRSSLRTTYFDTPALDLRAAGLSFRVRKSGSSFVQTVKSNGKIEGGVADVLEIESDVEGERPSIEAIPHKRTRRRLRNAIGEAALRPVVRTDVDRAVWSIETPSGDCVEIALDRGRVTAGKRSVRISEIEIELKRGSPASLLALAKAVVPGGPVSPSLFNKADRGYQLLGRSFEQPKDAVKAVPAVIERDMPARDAIAACFTASASHALRNWQVHVETGSAESAHQLRVGLRRLRTALRIFETLAESADIGSPGDRIRQAALAVGRLRDLDVLIADIVEPASHLDQTQSIEAVKARLRAERESAGAELRTSLMGPDLGFLRVEIALLPSLVEHTLCSGEERFRNDGGDFARRAIRRLLARLRKRARSMPDLGVEQRHDFRKALKPLRYAVEFFGPFLPTREVRRFLRSASALQDQLGYLNDAALSNRLLALEWSADAAGLRAARACGLIAGWHHAHAERAWPDAAQQWRRVEKAAAALTA